MTRAVGVTKVMNLTSNVIALTMFAVGGNVYYSAGIAMAIGQIIGTRIGSSLAISKGTAFIRPIFVSVVLVTIARLFYLNYLT